jgi:hypothetical protein
MAASKPTSAASEALSMWGKMIVRIHDPFVENLEVSLVVALKRAATDD